MVLLTLLNIPFANKSLIALLFEMNGMGGGGTSSKIFRVERGWEPRKVSGTWAQINSGVFTGGKTSRHRSRASLIYLTSVNGELRLRGGPRRLSLWNRDFFWFEKVSDPSFREIGGKLKTNWLIPLSKKINTKKRIGHRKEKKKH